MHTGSASIQSSYRYERIIKDKLLQGLSSIRIFQDLKAECGYSGSYYSVRRYTNTLNIRLDPPFRRMETRPSEEMQVYFGQCAWIIDAVKRPHLFLSCIKLLQEVLFRGRLQTRHRELFTLLGKCFQVLRWCYSTHRK